MVSTVASQTGLRHADLAAAILHINLLIHYTLNLDLNWDTGMNQIWSLSPRWGEGLIQISNKKSRIPSRQPGEGRAAPSMGLLGTGLDSAGLENVF